MQLEFKIYPNPTTDYLNVVSTVDIPQEFKVVLLDQLGKTVLTKRSTHLSAAKNLEVDVKTVPKGVYVLQLSAGNLIRSFKVILR